MSGLTATQEAAIVEACREPRIVQEIADMVGASKWAIYKLMPNLVRAGRVIEMPFRREGSKQYLATGEKDFMGRILFHSARGKDYTMAELMGNAEVSGTAAFKVIARALAHMYMRSYGLVSGQTHLRGVVTTIQTKQQMREMHNFLKQWCNWLEAMLVSDLWNDDNPDFMEQFGPCDPAEAQTLAAEYNDARSIYRPKVVQAVGED